ncbi:MAG: formylmethanofuran dehydrogenase subunit C [Planctomycetota bacterium]
MIRAKFKPKQTTPPLHHHHMTLVLSLIRPSRLPTEVHGITPDRLVAMSPADIARLTILQGNQRLPLADLFQISGSATDMEIVFQGELDSVHWIGAGMVSGHIRAEGNVGRHVGSGMVGGELTVIGSADGWAGAEMHGGLLRILGSAGPLAGGAYRGATKGMTGGTLLIHGDAGSECGLVMRRGLIAIGGSCGDYPAFNMLAGALIVSGNTGLRPGAGMRRGTLALLGTNPPDLLPTFRYSAVLHPTALRLVLQRLQQLQFPVDPELYAARFELFRGDLVAGGKGEILRIAQGQPL